MTGLFKYFLLYNMCGVHRSSARIPWLDWLVHHFEVDDRVCFTDMDVMLMFVYFTHMVLFNLTSFRLLYVCLTVV